MEVKKTEKANLENKKLLFTEIGLVISLLIVFVAFEWTSKEKQVATLEDTTQMVAEEEVIPITQETPPPPPAAPKV
ncbi:MAG: energy transducer TonB, partial [Candidatus Cryptobacteroides sp.]